MNYDKNYVFKKGILTAAVSCALFGTALSVSAEEETSKTDDAAKIKENKKDLEEVVVTGSLIPRDGFTGPNPMVVMDKDAMKERGFVNLTDVMDSLTQSTGAVQGEQYTNSFTPAAQDVNLRGFGAGRTLVLLNGRRLADYPAPYNSESNFFNFSSIPLSAVERIEVMTSGASAVYGSDAIAGVVNIITRKNVEDTTISFRRGTTTEGGGDSQQLQFVTGHFFDRGSFTITGEYQEQDPIYGKDRGFMDSYMDRPLSTRYPDRAILTMDNFTAHYIDPGSDACDDSLTGYGYSERPDKPAGAGLYCGNDGDGEESLRSYRERMSVFFDGRFELNNGVELFANAMYWDSTVEQRNFKLWWGGDILTEDFDWLYLQRFFTAEETGDQEVGFDENTWNLTLGAKGEVALFNKTFDWEVALTNSEYDYSSTQVRFKEEAIDEYFLGTEDLWGYGYLSGNPDHSIYTAFTPEILGPMMGMNDETGDSYGRQLNAKVTGELTEFNWMAGPIQMALQVEYAKQGYTLTPHPRALNKTGNGWWGLSATGGGGDRNRSAVGMEFLLPVTDDLEVTVASRYDRYDDGSDVGGRPTSQVKFLYNPVDWLTVRGGWSQSFRAPDMHYLFAGESGFYTTVKDTYRCETETDYDCAYGSEQGYREGNLMLKEETGTNLNFGFVVRPLDQLSLSVDLYRVKLRDIVNDESSQDLLDLEADCRTGDLDPNSARCLDVLQRVAREENPLSGDMELQSLSLLPINQSILNQTGVDMQLDYRYNTDNYGEFRLNLGYTNVIDYEEQIFSSDPVVDVRNALDNYEPRSYVNGSVSWNYGSFSTTVFARRIGSTPNYDEDARVSSWKTINMTATYDVNENLRFSLMSNNLLNERPPVDDTWTAWPYFYRGQYNGFGRELFAEVQYRF